MSNPAPISNSPTPSQPSLPLPSSTTMAIQSRESSTSRRAKPNTKLQTSFLPTINSTNSVPTSAISSSSVTSSQQQSPIMSPQLNQLATSNSSVQASPEGPRGRETESLPPSFELPESIVSYTTKSGQSAMSEVMSQSKSTGLIRRLSNKASKFAAGRRRQSNTAMNREHSSGPVIMRRRSDSNSTAPEGTRPSLFADSEDDDDITYEESIPDIVDGISISGTTVTPVSTNINTNTILSEGPVIPFVLLQGTTMTKVTEKKKKKKNLTFVLDIERAKVSWDKNKLSKSFYIDDIKEIRCGSEARNYRQEFGISLADESRFFSIVYAIPDKSKGRGQKIMHLIAGDEQTVELWTSTLDAISKHRHDFMASLSSFNDKAVRSYWQREMNRKFGEKPHSIEDEEIDLVGVQRLCRDIHINTSTNYLKSKFNEADTTRTGRLTFAEFQGFVGLMKQREDVRAIYRGISTNPEKGVTLEEFLYFLRDSQNENVDDSRVHWENVFAKFVRRSKPRDQQQSASDDEPRMSEYGLTSFLTSTYNVPIHELPAKLSFDRPLNEYFISSSHNTYLLGRQVAGQSSVEAYITALLRGCRCVEVDCWNGPQGPIVMHGRTWTSDVSFVDVMSTIRKYAFVKTSFPLWISLEVHCSAVQQEEMAKIIKDTCGDALVTEPIDPNTTTLPTPMDLLNRILIKVKRPHVASKPMETETSSIRTRGNSVNSMSSQSPFIRPSQLDNSSVPPQSPLMTPQHRLTRMISNRQMRIAPISETPDSTSSNTSDSDSLNEEVKAGEDFPANRKKTSKIVPVLGNLGVYSAGLKFHGFDDPEAKTHNHIFSFMEQTFTKNSRNPDDRHALIMHNMRYMMRVYPNGWRLASTNFDPLTYWRRGVQMAALNWQTYDLGMQINDAMFAAGSDQTGYVLKPAELRGPIRLENVTEAKIKKSRKNVSFEVDVISAQQLMRPKHLGANQNFNPYVEVEVYHADDKGKDFKGVVGEGGFDASGRDGPSGLGTPHRRRTQIVEENGFNPLYDNKFVFNLTTKYPDLVFIRFSVRHSTTGREYSDRGPPLATYTVKLGSIKQGYRTIPLMDAHGDQFLFSTLFCRIKIDAPTTLYLEDAEAPSSLRVLKSIGRKLAGNPISPKSSMDSA